MIIPNTNYGGWGRTHLSRSRAFELPIDSFLSPYESGPIIPRGNGLSYGDASTLENGSVLLNSNFRGLSIDGDILTVGSGETISSATKFLRERQYELPVVPGTGNVTIGGAISADIHGKNHHKVGSFGNHVLELEVDTPNQGRIWIKRSDPGLAFASFIGGMGLTGLIYRAKLKVVPRLSDYVRVKRLSGSGFSSLLEILRGESLSNAYSIAWIDLARISLTKDPRWILDSGNDEHGRFESTQKSKQPVIKLPLVPVTWPKPIIQLANNFLYKASSKSPLHSVRKDSYFHPLDRVANWNRAIGRRGFVEYQFVLPFDSALAALSKISRVLVANQQFAVFAGIKSMGSASTGLLSFPMEGITLAMDIQVKGHQPHVALDLIDKVVLNAGGRVYLAKDSRLSADVFKLMYPKAKLLSELRFATGCTGKIASDMSLRLEIE